MKTTATAVVWRRVLSVCLLCALWGEGTVRAGELSPGGAAVVLKGAGGEAGVGVRAVGEQKIVGLAVGALLKSLGAAAEKVKETSGGDEGKTSEAITAVETVVNDAQTLNNTVQGVVTVVAAAKKGAEKVAEEAQKLTESKYAGEARQKVLAAKKAAADAAELWGKVAEKAESQSTKTKNIFEVIQKAAEEVRTASETTDESQRKKAVADALTKLKTSLDGITDEANKLSASAPQLQAEMEKADEAITQAVDKIGDLVNVPGDEKKNKEDLKTSPQDPLGEADNTTKSDVTNKMGTESSTQNELNKDSSSDGSLLTVSCFAATSVLLLLSRVAALMITA